MSDIDWPAWVQAVGSVLAIGAAIWIDQGTARRQRRERKAVEESAVRARRSAVVNCQKAVDWMTAHLEKWQPAGNQIWSPSGSHLRALFGAHEALKYYLRHTTTDVDAALVITLTQAEQVMDECTSWFRENRVVREWERNGRLEELRTTADQLATLILEYHAIPETGYEGPILPAR